MKVKARGLLYWIHRHHSPCKHLRSVNLPWDLRTNRLGLWVNHSLNRSPNKQEDQSIPADAGGRQPEYILISKQSRENHHHKGYLLTQLYISILFSAPVSKSMHCSHIMFHLFLPVVLINQVPGLPEGSRPPPHCQDGIPAAKPEAPWAEWKGTAPGPAAPGSVPWC